VGVVRDSDSGAWQTWKSPEFCGVETQKPAGVNQRVIYVVVTLRWPINGGGFLDSQGCHLITDLSQV